MKKIVFQCVGNILLFTFMALAFLFPLSEVTQERYWIGGSLTIFPFLLIAYLIIYPVTYRLFAKKFQGGKGANSELAYLDEREKTIVAESTKIAYKVLVGGLIFIIPAIGGVRFFSLFSGIEISIYSTSIVLLATLLNVATVFYCIKWCLEYKK